MLPYRYSPLLVAAVSHRLAIRELGVTAPVAVLTVQCVKGKCSRWSRLSARTCI